MNQTPNISRRPIERSATRRDFLKSSAASLAALQVWQAIPRIGWASEALETDNFNRLFEFVQINDTHVQSPLGVAGEVKPSHTYARANDKFTWWVDTVNRQPQPDFIVAIGDLVHGGRLDRLPGDFDQLKQLLKPLEPPLTTRT